jgi:hypothetical protein
VGRESELVSCSADPSVERRGQFGHVESQRTEPSGSNLGRGERRLCDVVGEKNSEMPAYAVLGSFAANWLRVGLTRNLRLPRALGTAMVSG